MNIADRKISSATATSLDPQPASGVHPVHSLQQRIQAAFNAKKPSNDQSGVDDCVIVINRFLALTGWAQGKRRIFESMPHADDVNTIAAFRTVLFRLGFSTIVEPVTKSVLRDEYLPCFIRQHDGRLLLAEKSDDEGTIRLFDPAHGKSERVAINTITGLVIFPEALTRREAQTAASPKWSSTIIAKLRPMLRQLFAISFIINLFAFAPPLFVMFVYDKAVGSKSLDVLLGLAIGVSLIVAADFALRHLRVRMQSYLGARLDEQLNETAFRHLLHLSLSHTDDAPIGSQLTRLRQMTSLHEAFTGPLVNAFFDLPFVLLFIAVIALISGPLVWVPVTLMVVYGLTAAWAIPQTSKLVRRAGDVRAQLNNLTMEAVSSQRAIRDLGAESIWLRRQRRLSAEAATANMNARQLNFLIQTFSQAVVAIAGVGILTLGTGLVIAGDLSAGALIAVMALSWRVLGPIRNLFLSGLMLGQTLQSVQQIDRLVRLPLEREPSTGPTIPRSFNGNVVFDKVTFRYPGQREPSLKGVSFQVKPGQLLCLYGRGGSGTSTALRVLLGLYQQQAGSIFVDGLDLRQLDLGEWRNAIGVGLHSPDFFHGTVAQNIRLARPDATDEELHNIVRKLGIDSYFDSVLSEGLETRCSVMARATWPDALLSRIALARAFIKESPIYILDEPAATLDDDGERALLSFIAEKRRESAIIMTTQRPSHMRMADIVVWMDQGMVRDAGEPALVVPKIMAAQSNAA